ncbi:hypothetical protein PPGU19_071360 (plasmid) [Paraburkholderia sp. PGU19]|nr:hypothetical protein PPGU19_071360 [Paraburkholderia sp. PGU19]
MALVAKNRVQRFGSELLLRMYEFFHVDVVVLEAIRDVSRDQQLTEHLVEILTVSSTRLYVSRGRKTLRALLGLMQSTTRPDRLSPRLTHGRSTG